MTFETRYSKYGYGMDVRSTYGSLPCQPFWTWLTGKDIRRLNPRKPTETLLTEWQLWCQIAWSWSIIILFTVVGSIVYNSELSILAKIPIFVVCWVLVVNRTRGLLHSFHYTNHGASIANMGRAKWIAKYFMNIPILHTPWENYHDIHARDHHSVIDLCTDNDPDEVFMKENGFRMGMSEREYWLKLVLAPFNPRAIWAHLKFRLMQNFVQTTNAERIPRITFWILFFGAVAAAGVLEEVAIFYLFPLLILTQFSSWIQHTTEHLWFARHPEGVSRFVYYGSLTWGRFLGRPYPAAGTPRRALRLAKWWTLTLIVDLPIRLFSFMQDLPSHDLHHRSPRVNFWSVARERAAHEARPSKFGPMTETWGMVECWLILRDHLCRGINDPFALYDWDRQRSKTTYMASAAE